MKKSGQPSSTPLPLSRKKKRVFTFLTALMPLLLLLLLEGLLRVTGYGYNMDLFINYAPNHDYVVLNPDASKKYFVNEALAPSGNSEIFKKKKDENTLRFFVLGESTTIGFPYFHNGSFHRWLLYRLMQTYPDKQFEIINLSFTAVNSYTVLDISQQIIKYAPDAVLIYSGHNEYYGAMGVGSTNKIANNRWLTRLMLQLRQLRLTQLITNIILNIKSAEKSPDINGGETFMQLMVSEQRIPFQSSLYEKGLDQFRQNTSEALDIFENNHIPVFISNVVSNEKDLRPFVSEQPDNSKLPDFSFNYLLGEKAYTLNEQDSACHYFAIADNLFKKNALCKYYMGKLAYTKGDYTDAKQRFTLAADLDELRFRAPGKLNEIIAQLCNNRPGVYMVDAKTAFELYSDNKIIGDKLMLEHVHPNLLGYALLSNAFYETMKKSGVLVNNDNEISFDSLLVAMPITKMDSLTGSYRIAILKNNWPFRSPAAPPSADTAQVETEEEHLSHQVVGKKLSWPLAMEELFTFYSKRRDYVNAKKVIEALVLEHPTEPSLYEKAANICGEMKEYEQAAFYFKKVFELSPSFNIAKFLFVIYLKLDKPADAIPYLDYAIKNNTSGVNLRRIKTQTSEIIALQKSYSPGSAGISATNQIAKAYLVMGNIEGANKYISISRQHDPKNQEALELLNIIKSGINNHAKSQ